MKNKITLAIITAVVLTTIISVVFAQNYPGCPMNSSFYGLSGSWMVFGWIIYILIAGLLIAGIYWLIKSANKK